VASNRSPGVDVLTDAYRDGRVSHTMPVADPHAGSGCVDKEPQMLTGAVDLAVMALAGLLRTGRWFGRLPGRAVLSRSHR
jgi:hypothetical protein